MDDKIDYLTFKCKQAIEKEDYDTLLDSATELEKLVEDKYLAKSWQALAYYYKKEFAKAGTIFYNLYTGNIKDRKEDDTLLFYLGMTYFYLKRLKECIKVFEKLEKKDPTNIDFRMMLYLALYLDGDKQDAALELAEALRIDKKKTAITLESILQKAIKDSKLSDETKRLIKELAQELGND